MMEKKPWGEHCVLAQGDGWKTKQLVIYPNGILSLQRHKHREEQWLVVSGTPTVQIGKGTYVLSPKQLVKISKNEVHRISNFSKENVTIIETQFGDYLEEDDIERLEDIYSR